MTPAWVEIVLWAAFGGGVAGAFLAPILALVVLAGILRRTGR